MKVSALIEALKEYNQEAEVHIKVQHSIGHILHGAVDHITETTQPSQVMLISDASAINAAI